jgi:hypothetical protein
MRYIVKLETAEVDGETCDIWIASWIGEPAMTLRQDLAQRYDTREKAGFALVRARKWQSFLDAEIVEVER